MNCCSIHISLCRDTYLIGVELHDDVIEHCKSSFAKWKVTSMSEGENNVSTITFMDDTPNIHIIRGNGLNILNSEGESVVGYDRIYIGAAVDRTELTNITKLLSPGGILVGPGKKFYQLIILLLGSSFPLCTNQLLLYIHSLSRR